MRGQAPPTDSTPASMAATTSAAPAPPTESELPQNSTPAECVLSCEAPQMIPRPSIEPDYTQREIDNANEVLAAMHDDILACYKKRVRARPDAHGFITVDILVGAGGRVAHVDTTGGAVLGEGTMRCIVDCIERGEFEPPHGGGTIHVRVPFSLRRVAPGEEP